jgi:hypothetical protein
VIIVLPLQTCSNQTKDKEMNRMIIQVDGDRVAYDGRDWTPVAGERA